jgi:hypothetical protein
MGPWKTFESTIVRLMRSYEDTGSVVCLTTKGRKLGLLFSLNGFPVGSLPVYWWQLTANAWQTILISHHYHEIHFLIFILMMAPNSIIEYWFFRMLNILSSELHPLVSILLLLYLKKKITPRTSMIRVFLFRNKPTAK